MKYYAHETAVIDEGCEIGEDTKIWHFSHIMPNCKIGQKCNICLLYTSPSPRDLSTSRMPSSA